MPGAYRGPLTNVLWVLSASECASSETFAEVTVSVQLKRPDGSLLYEFIERGLN